MMEQDITIESPVMLRMWLGFHRPEMQITDKDAEILLNYLEGHDYSLMIRNEELMRKDLAEENGEIEPYDIDDVIDAVCEWNYELMYDAREGMENPENFIDFCNYRETYNALKEDVPHLNALFGQTRYGRETKEMVHTVLAKSNIKGLPDTECVVRTTAEEELVQAEQGKVR